MAKYKSIVTTEAGLSLLENAAYIGGAIQFVALKTGNGTYDGTEDLSKLTDLKNVRQTFGVAGVSKKDLDIVIRAVIDNDDVTEGYYLTEIGLYAENPNTEATVLYAIIIAEEGNEDYLPPYDATPTRITLEMNVGITESEEAVTFSAPSLEGVYVSAQDFEEHTSKAENPHGVTAEQVGLGNVPNVATNDQTPTYTAESTLAALTTGEKLSAALGKIAKAVSDLISHLADGVKHITAAERSAWNAKLDATATAADSDKLDGHDSVYFATATSVANIVTGATTVGSASKATTDASGNNIENTYSTKVEVEKILAGIESGETATGNAAALGGKTSAEWQAEIDNIVDGTTPVSEASNAAALGGETASAWQTKLDNIQTTSRANFDTAGWYRVARIKDTNFKTFQFIITRAWHNQAPETYVLRYTSGGSNLARFECLSALCGVQFVSKVRLTTDGTYQYLEIYYAQSKSNLVAFEINNLNMAAYYPTYWEMYSASEATSETVDGVTVITTYDIPANAKPAMDLDLVQFSGFEVLYTSILDKALELTRGVYQYAHLGGSASTATDYPKASYKYSSGTIFKRGDTDIVVILWGRGDAVYPQYNYYNGTWSGWNQFTMSSDLTTALAGYLPLDGSKAMSGNLEVKTTAEEIRKVAVENAKRRLTFEVDLSGNGYIWDGTNNKAIATFNADGVTNTIDGTASGNLALNGGGTVQAGSRAPVTLENLTNSIAYTGYKGTTGDLGLLGFNGVDEPAFRSVDGVVNQLLHAGNYTDYALAKTGGFLENASDTILGLRNTSSDKVMERFDGASGVLGYLGFDNVDSPIVYSSTLGTQALHHDGNSAKVAVSETPLTAEGSVRVW